MKRTKIVTLMFALVLSFVLTASAETKTPEPSSKNEEMIYAEMIGACYLRSEPDYGDNILDEFSEGTTVEVVGCYGDWLHVKADGGEGYIGSRFIDTNSIDIDAIPIEDIEKVNETKEKAKASDKSKGESTTKKETSGSSDGKSGSGFIEPSESYSSKSDLEVYNVKLESNSTYTVCTGKVKNRGNKTYRFVKVKGNFKAKNGNTIDTDTTYVVGDEGLAPGESSSFWMSVPKDGNIASVSVTVYDYQ